MITQHKIFIKRSCSENKYFSVYIFRVSPIDPLCLFTFRVIKTWNEKKRRNYLYTFWQNSKRVDNNATILRKKKHYPYIQKTLFVSISVKTK